MKLLLNSVTTKIMRAMLAIVRATKPSIWWDHWLGSE